MPVPLHICQICLRTDKKLLSIANALSEYYDELAEYSLDITYPQCCVECEHLLRKSYNFKRKCLVAAKILQKWINTRAKARKPLDSLHTLIPPSPMGVWIEENNKIFSLYYGNLSEQSEMNENEDSTAVNTIKIEKDIDSYSETTLLDVKELKTENTDSLHEFLIINEGRLSNIVNPEEIETFVYKVEGDDGNEEPEETDLTTDEKNEENANERSVLEMEDDGSLNSDDDYDYSKELPESRRKIIELANDKETAVEKKLNKVNEDVEEIYKEWEKTYSELPKTLKNNPNDNGEVLKNLLKRKIVDREDLKRQSNLKRRGTLAQLANLNADLNAMHESCMKIINSEDKLQDP